MQIAVVKKEKLQRIIMKQYAAGDRKMFEVQMNDSKLKDEQSETFLLWNKIKK